MKLIELSQGQFARVDDSKFNYLNQFEWSAYKDGSTFYAKRHVMRQRKRTTISMHREIMDAKWNEIIDHKDGDGLNCQEHNLRRATRSQNGANRNPSKTGASKYLGVSVTKENNWKARIRKDKKQITIGIFTDEIEAARAYNDKAIELHGEFAKINKI